MRSLIVSCNVTVDGYMAGPYDDLASLDFIADDPELENDLAGRFRSTADTIVVGRQTFLDMEAYWTKVDSPMAAWLNATPKVVLSTDEGFDVSVWPNSRLAAGDGADRVRRLKDVSGAAIVAFGGVKTLRALAAAGLVDEYWLKISPVLLGRGSSMFADLAGRQDLTLRSAKSYPSGSVEALYATGGVRP